MHTDTDVDMTQEEQKLQGPHGLVLELDAGEMYPKDPGMGTPLLFSRKHNRRTETMTWACGYEGGNLGELFPECRSDRDDEIQEALEWAAEIADEVVQWEEIHWKRAENRLAGIENVPLHMIED